ncbi:SBBP repeat-containing protein [candidate division KSB1 bacterium]|nr:SBBP repeat-containing protein [candidate division KSB1 bacterium]
MKINRNNPRIALTVLFILGIVLFSTSEAGAQAPEFIWAERFGGTDQETPNDIATDDAGNIFLTGTSPFGQIGTIGFDVIIAKFDNNGKVLWANQAGGPEWDEGMAVTADENGNCIVTGTFTFTATFGSETIYAQGIKDIFVARYDPSGHLVWVKSYGGLDASGHDDDCGRDIIADGSGNIFVIGQFWGTASFGSTNLTSAGEADMFIAKCDPNGNVLWAVRGGGVEKDGGEKIALDDEGNLYVAGYFRSTATFGSHQLTSSGKLDLFIAKYDASGNLLWIKQAGGPDYDSVLGFGIDESDNIYCCGTFADSVTFEETTLHSLGDDDIFIAHFDASGNLNWAKQAGSPNYEAAVDLTLDESGNLTMIGYFNESITFEDTTLTGVAYNDVFVTSYSAEGQLLWANLIGGTNFDRGYGITTDNESNNIITGTFAGTLPIGEFELTSVGSKDIFIAKLQPPTVSISDFLVETGSVSVPAASTRLKVHASDDYAYMVDYGATITDGAFFIADVSDRSNPVLRGSIPNVASKNIHDLWYADGYAYTTHRGFPVKMIDVSNPDNPTVVSSANISYNHAGIRTRGDYLYVAEHSSGSWGGVRVYDVSTGLLNEVGFYHGDVDGRYLCITSDGAIMYQSSAANKWPPEEILIYDLSDKAHPNLVKTFNAGYMAHCMALSPDDHTLYMSVGPEGSPVQGFQVWDISDKINPQLITTYDNVLFYTFALYPPADLVFASAVFDQVNAIYVLDVSDPLNIQLLETYPGIAGELSIDSGYLYVGDPGSGAVGLRIYQINAGETPVLSVTPTTLDFGTTATSMTFDISNTGSGTLNWTVSEVIDKPWLTAIDPANGTGDAAITLTVDRNKMSGNSDSGTLLVSSNGGDQIVDIIISREIVPFPANRVNDDDQGVNQIVPAIAVAKDGHFVITWCDDNGTSSDVHAQLFDSQNQKIGSNFKVNDEPLCFKTTVDVAIAFDGTFMIVWTDYVNLPCGGSNAIYARRFDANGNKLGNKINVFDHASFPAIAVAGDGTYLIVHFNNSTLEGCLYDVNGNQIGNTLYLPHNRIECGYPDIDASSDGFFVVVWEYGIDRRHISTQCVNSNGDLIGDCFKVDDYGETQVDAKSSFAPSVAVADDRSFVITWDDDYGVWGKRYNKDRVQLGEKFRINESSAISAISSEVSMNDNNEFVVAWVEYRNSNYDICAQRFFSDGTPDGAIYVVNQDTENAGQTAPDVGFISGKICFAWQDNRVLYQGWDIFNRVETIETYKTAHLSLNQGWNMFSINVNPIDPAIENVMQPVENQLVLVKNSAGQTYIPAYGINDIGNIDFKEGYQAYLKNTSSLDVTGMKLDATTPISLPKGWSMISYLPTVAIDAAVALGSISDKLVIAKNNAGQTYIPAYGINDIGNMQPGQGYQVYLNAAGTLVYPSGSGLQVLAKAYENKSVPNASPVHFQFAACTGENATAIIPATAMNALQPEAGDEIGIFTPEGQCCGAAVWQDRNLAFTVWGDNLQTDPVDGFKPGEALSFRLWKKRTDEELPIEAEFTEKADRLYRADGLFVSATMRLEEHDAIQHTSLPTAFKLLQNYPNPFNAATTIQYHLPMTAQVQLAIYDINGNEVATVENRVFEPGYHQATWDGRDASGRIAASGVYFYRIKMKSEQNQSSPYEEVKKLILLK